MTLISLLVFYLYNLTNGTLSTNFVSGNVLLAGSQRGAWRLHINLAKLPIWAHWVILRNKLYVMKIVEVITAHSLLIPQIPIGTSRLLIGVDDNFLSRDNSAWFKSMNRSWLNPYSIVKVWILSDFFNRFVLLPKFAHKWGNSRVSTLIFEHCNLIWL